MHVWSHHCRDRLFQQSWNWSNGGRNKAVLFQYVHVCVSESNMYIIKYSKCIYIYIITIVTHPAGQISSPNLELRWRTWVHGGFTDSRFHGFTVSPSIWYIYIYIYIRYIFYKDGRRYIYYIEYILHYIYRNVKSHIIPIYHDSMMLGLWVGKLCQSATCDLGYPFLG